MQRRAAAVSAVLALLLITTAALAGKPIRTLPRPSASRSAGPESLARAGRRQKTQLAEARSTRRNRIRSVAKATGRSTTAREHASARRQRSSSARADKPQTDAREVRVRQRRGSKRSHSADRDEQPANRKLVSATRRSRRGKSSENVAAHSVRPIRADDTEDPTLATVSTRQAFSSISPLKSVQQDAACPMWPNLRAVSLYDSRGRLMVPAPLYGSHEILLHQNEMADRDGLGRIRDSSGLEDLLHEKKLVALPAGESLQVDDRLPGDRRYSRPWTAAFLSVLARDFYANFHEPLYVTSAVRTIQVQQRLVRTNGNAAPVSGDNASPHLTGQAVDIAKKGMSMVQIAWLRTYLQPLIGDGKIDVEEEFRQACFHISVYRSYLPAVPRLSIASTHETAASTQP